MTMATPVGRHFRLGTTVDLPTKLPGRHRWILSSAFTITDEQARVAHEGVSSVLMGPDNLLSFGVGCWDCEQVYQEAFTDPCPGDPSGHDD